MVKVNIVKCNYSSNTSLHIKVHSNTISNSTELLKKKILSDIFSKMKWNKMLKIFVTFVTKSEVGKGVAALKNFLCQHVLLILHEHLFVFNISCGNLSL